MSDASAHDRWTGRLAELPVAVRLMLTAFLAMVGFGYLAAVANIYYRHQAADGRAGLSLGDIRAVYSGLSTADGAPTPAVSRMLTMLRGEMRQYVSSESDFSILETWLTEGASEKGLDEGEGRKTPRRVILRDCLRCHAKSTGTDISRIAPFGPDEFTVDYAMIAPLAAMEKSADGKAASSPPQYTMPRLVLVSHMHMLAIPMFTLVVGLLFMMTRLPWGLRSGLAPLPMLALVFDFAGWGLARWSGGFIYFIAAGGAVFGVTFGIQILVTAWDMWRRPAPPGHGDFT
ncbi:MAG TPA: hypothetical protein VJZ71_08090 [Phycisphaerae bacterium]|nr:hypothetical protein [Phycisphaerae bacterium]